MTIRTQSDAKKHGRGPDEALALVRRATRVIVVRGNKVREFDLQSDPPDDATLLSAILGPSGKLRAPTLVRGETVVVGFHPEAYRSALE